MESFFLYGVVNIKNFLFYVPIQIVRRIFSMYLTKFDISGARQCSNIWHSSRLIRIFAALIH